MPNPVLLIAPDGKIVDANMAAESFFEISTQFLQRQSLKELVPFGSPLLALVDQVREQRLAGQRIQGRSRHAADRRRPAWSISTSRRCPSGPAHVVVMLQERTMADKMDRQLTHRSAARSVIALAAMLAHEIKNPLSGIRGAAQLLEQAASDEDRALTRLICDETDRIVTLVDRMEVFGDDRPVDARPVNIHAVLDHVKRLAQSGFARNITLRRGLRSVAAAGARQPRPADPGVPQSGEERRRGGRRCGADGEIPLTTAFRPGVRAVGAGHARSRVSLPLEFCVKTTARACRTICCRICSIRSSPPSRTAPASAWRWSPRSSATMAASSNANRSRAAPSSACCCRCSRRDDAVPSGRDHGEDER